MLTKNKIIMIISLGYWGLILGNTISMIGIELAEDEIVLSRITIFTLEQLLTFTTFMLFMFLFLLFISMLKHFLFTVIYFGAIVTIKKFYKEKIDITDKKTDNYYRELLSRNSVGVLGYIRDFNVNEKELAATILSLELKDRISIEDKIMVTNSSLEGLDSNEIYVLENLVSNNGKNINIITYSNKVFNDCMRQGLLTKKTDFKRKRNLKIISFVILMVLYVLNFIFMPDFFNKYIGGKADWLVYLFFIFIFGGFFLMIITPSISIVRLISYSIMSKLDPYVRNKKAMEINNKLNGLENFLKDFSIIHERDRKELKLWREYLIYSVIFEQNNDIRDEIIAKLKS